MKKAIYLLLFAMVATTFATFSSCKKDDNKDDQDQDPQIQWTIYMYGRPSCGFCAGLKNDLDAESIAYTFYDIDNEADKNQEMWDKLNAAGMGGGSVGLPVVDVEVDGTANMFIRPDVETDIKPLIGM